MDEVFRSASVIPNMILAQLKASWRRQKLFLLDGRVRGRQATYNRTMAMLKMCCRRKKRFLMD